MRREGEKHQCVIACPLPLLGAWPATHACALTENWTIELLVCRPALKPLSHTSQDHTLVLWTGRVISLPSQPCLYKPAQCISISIQCPMTLTWIEIGCFQLLRCLGCHSPLSKSLSPKASPWPTESSLIIFLGIWTLSYYDPSSWWIIHWVESEAI